MNEVLTQQLYRLYTAEVYSVLAINDDRYQKSLQAAGLGWNGEAGITQSNRLSFETEMRMQAGFAAQYIRDQASLEPSTTKAQLLSGPQKLYRVASSISKAPTGVWWFSEKVAAHCRKEAGAKPQDRLDWLRNVLAVCFNFGRFDKLERFSLRQGESIPTVIGKGLPMPYYKIDPYIHKDTGIRVIDNFPKDYWQKKGLMLFGGELQTVLPWVPKLRVHPIDSL